MRAVLPGEPQARLQAFSTAQWNRKRYTCYISGNAFVILGGPQELLQTTYIDQANALTAIVIDKSSGKIAVSSSEEVYIYAPVGWDEGVLRWILKSTISLPGTDSVGCALSWGSEEQLLIGDESLRLYDTLRDDNNIWECALARSAMVARFAPDGGMLATAGWNDRLVKIWRRQSFDPDDTRFDFVYLPHSTTVTGVEWRIPARHQHTYYESLVDHVLYTTCADSKIRIWAASDPHSTRGLQLWAEIDMQQSLQSRALAAKPAGDGRFTFFVNSDDFSDAAASMIEQPDKDLEEHAHVLDHLTEIANAHPDVCIVLDQHGRLSTWGFQGVGSKAKKGSDVFNISHVNDVQLDFSPDSDTATNTVRFQVFREASATLTVLIHYFDGGIVWNEVKLQHLVGQLPCDRRFQPKATWTGPGGIVTQLSAADSGKTFLARTDGSEASAWSFRGEQESILLRRQCRLLPRQGILSTRFLTDERYLLVLTSSELSLWDCRAATAELEKCNVLLRGRSLSLISLSWQASDEGAEIFIVMNDAMDGCVFEVSTLVQDARKHSIREVSKFQNTRGNMTFVDQVSTDEASRVQNRIFTGDTHGSLYLWRPKLDQESGQLKLQLESEVGTGVERPFLIAKNADGHAAIVDEEHTTLTIWNLCTSELEHDENFGLLDAIQDIRWAPQLLTGSLLAVAFSHKISILAEKRYDFATGESPWVSIHHFDIKEFSTYPISNSMWLADYHVVASAGSQLFAWDQRVVPALSNDRIPKTNSTSDDTHTLAQTTASLSAPLPIYHPELLDEAVASGDLEIIHYVLTNLNEKLKYFSEGDNLDPFLSIDTETLSAGMRDRQYIDDEVMSTESFADSLRGKVKDALLPGLEDGDRKHLDHSINSAADNDRFRGSLDTKALQFLYFFLHANQEVSETTRTKQNLIWRSNVWALHSITQDALIGALSRYMGGNMIWKDAHRSGVFLWMTDLVSLKQQFELVARNEYAKSDSRDPTDCSLYYLALKKKTVLIGLWRMATWNKEQRGTLRLLANDFSQARWKTAALKNAYALLGKRRFEYAAAWFLLADHLSDAVNVCVNQMEDWQLGVIIARIYGGDEDNTVLRNILQIHVLPLAMSQANRWLVSWVLWMLGEKQQAARALVLPLDEVTTLRFEATPFARSYLANEPSLVYAYQQVASKATNALKPMQIISPEEEWRAVLRSALRYDRMGCGILALRLLHSWRFRTAERGLQVNGHAPAQDVQDEQPEINAWADSAHSKAESTQEKRKPTTFVEPDASNLLDSFGF